LLGFGPSIQGGTIQSSAERAHALGKMEAVHAAREKEY
jgi:hypothetical protein